MSSFDLPFHLQEFRVPPDFTQNHLSDETEKQASGNLFRFTLLINRGRRRSNLDNDTQEAISIKSVHQTLTA